jgi:hypothetical protein
MRPALLSIFSIFILGDMPLTVGRDQIDFSHEIAPILKEHCVECHGGGKSKGGMSINTRRLFLEGEAAVPGNAMESLFLELIEEPDPEYRMPSDDKPPVPDAQVALLKQWVNEGMDIAAAFSRVASYSGWSRSSGGSFNRFLSGRGRSAASGADR